MSGLGRIVSAFHVAEAAEATQKLWLPSVLADTARQHGLNPAKVPGPKTWGLLENPQSAGPRQLPALLIDSPGIVGDPRRNGSGLYSVDYEVHAYIVVRGTDYRTSAQLVAVYTAAVRAAFLQHPSLGGFAAGVRWLDEDLQPGQTDQSRTLREGFVAIAVHVDDVVDAFAGPAAPPADPLTEDPEDPVAISAAVRFQPKE